MNEQERHDKLIDSLVKEDMRYPADAYLFVEEAVPFAVKDNMKNTALRGSRHVTGQELVMSMVKLLLQKYGPMALDVLQLWNIHKTQDFGNLVYRLVKVKLLGVSPEDSPADFVDVVDLKEALNRPFVSDKPMPEIPRII